MNRFQTYLVQAFAVTFLLYGAASVSAQNLISNPGFETGTTGAGWTLWTDASATTAVSAVTYPATGAHSGTRYARVDVTVPAEQNWHIQYQIPPDWTAVNGMTYELKFWAKSDSGTNIHVAVQDGPDNNYAYRTGTSFGIATAWTEYVVSYTSDVAGNGALRFNLYVGESRDTYSFDDFSLLAVTVPVRPGAPGVEAATQGLQVRREAGRFVLSLAENAASTSHWNAELFDLSGHRLATASSASADANGSVRLASPGKGVYLIRAHTATHAWLRKVEVR